MFNTARLKLTGWYLLIIMSISLVFSLVIYQVLSNELERLEKTRKLKIERRIQEGVLGPQLEKFFSLVPIADPDLVDEARRRVLVTLGLANAAILVASGGLGYILAGQTLAPIKDMMDEQTRFITDASHELRTPLTSLKSTMEVYLRDKKPTVTEAKELVRESIEEVDKLKLLSDALLQLSRYQKPSGNMKFEKVSTMEVFQEALKRITPLAKKNNVVVRNETKEVKVEADKNSLVDLVVILLDNAIKYSPGGGEVVVRGNLKDRAWVMNISDRGIGISTEDIDKIFDRFYRSDMARSKNGIGGYGLGLAIAQQIVKTHHGSISAKSNIGSGSTFTVRLPTRQPKV